MRVGVSPATASSPTGIFNQRFEALFPRAGALGCAVCFTPLPFFPVYLCMSVGPRGLLAVVLPAPFISQSATSLGPATLPRVPYTPAARLCPSYQSGQMFLLYVLGCRTSLLFNFLSVLVVRGGAVCLPTPPSWPEPNLPSI